MKYRVIWDEDAFRGLVSQFSKTGRPQSAVDAFDEVERILSSDAASQGESRDVGDNRRILIVIPLGVIFRANSVLREALILDAWMIRRQTS